MVKNFKNPTQTSLLSLACTAGDRKLNVSSNIKLLNMQYIPYITRSISTLSKNKMAFTDCETCQFINFSKTKFSKTAGLWRCQQLNSDFL